METTRDSLPVWTDITRPRSPQIFFLIALLAFIAARLWQLTAACLWFDEVFSVHATRHSWPELIKFVAADIIHPPLFYAVLKFWIGLGGESLLWLRLLPLILSIATIAPFYFLCRELNLKSSERNIALGLLAVSGFLIKYAQEVRMYSLLLLLTVTSIWLFIRYLKRNSSRGLLALSACNLLLVYTHYYGWLLIVAETFVVLLWHRKKFIVFLLSAAALFVTYLPWIYAVATFREPGRGLAQNIGWISRPRIGDVVEYFVLLNKPFLFSQSTLDRAVGFRIGWVALLLVGSALGILIFKRLRARALGDTERVMLILMLAPVILALLLSWLLPYSIWGTRHLIICAFPFFILAGIAIENLRPYWARVAFLIAFGCIASLGGATYLLKPVPKFTWCEWDDLVKQIRTSSSDSAPVVYTFEDLVGYHVWFAAKQSATHRINVTVVKGVPGVPDDPAFFLPRRFSEVTTVRPWEIQGQHIWIAFRARRWDENSPLISNLKAFGYELRNVSSMPAQGEQAFLVELWRER